MIPWEKTHRDLACGHLGDLSTRAFREGNTGKGLVLLSAAQRVAVESSPEESYRGGLAWAADLLTGDAVELFDAAVAAILAGKHPPGSLPAELEEMRAESPFAGKLRHEGKDRACERALTIMGCAPSAGLVPR